MTEVDEALTTEEAADRFRLSTKTVLSLASPGERLGRNAGRTGWCFLRSDLVAYVRGGRGAVS